MDGIAIIGAGFGGMAAAYDLRKAGHEITIYRSADYVGGLASGFKEPHWNWFVESSTITGSNRIVPCWD
jgi:uncharacterized protein with NAD-binding domain and iron-sulfur cluster